MLNKTPKDECQVCHRPEFGSVVPLGFSRWRHFECYPGSPSWVENYPLNAHTHEGDLMYNYALKVKS